MGQLRLARPRYVWSLELKRGALSIYEPSVRSEPAAVLLNDPCALPVFTGPDGAEDFHTA